MKYCTKCVMPDTRPRIQFNEEGICNACVWHEKKKEINWEEKWDSLKKLCKIYRSKKGSWDVIVPVSGGKDSSTIAYKFKHELGMHPLTITFAHPLPTRLGWTNWNNFVQTGFDNILITPDMESYRKFAKDFFINKGMPKQPFVVGISTAIIKLSKRLGINLICFAEQGEAEYGGQVKSISRFDREFLTGIYYEGQIDSGSYGPWWEVPTDNDLHSLYVTWFSNFWNWDPEKNAIFAKEHCGMEMMVGGNIGTFTNFAQNEDKLQDLHTFQMFTKHGFSRCSSDVSIETRWGRMTREQGVKIVNELDGLFPLEYLDAYCDYFQMTKKEFWDVINRFANKELLEYTGKPERPWILKEKVK